MNRWLLTMKYCSCLLLLWAATTCLFDFAYAATPDLGYLTRADCTTLNPVAYNTLCLNTDAGGSLVQGGFYIYRSAWQLTGAPPLTAAQRPSVPPNGTMIVVTDGSTTNACETGGGTNVTLCVFNSGTNHWQAAVTSTGGGATLQSVMTSGNSYNGATSPSTGLIISDGTVGQVFYSDPSFGPVRECYPDPTVCDVAQIIQPGMQFGLYSKDFSAYGFRFYPVAGSRNLMWPFPEASTRPRKTVYFDAGSINVDGTNCGAPTEQALNSAEKTWAFSCADSNSSIFSGKVRMPVAWDGGTVTFTLSLFHGTTESITFAGDFSAQCRGAGDAVNSTYGTGVAADVSITTANQVAEATTAAVTPNGSCAGGKFLWWRYVVDAANFSANAANSKVLGVSLAYLVSSLSD